MQQNTPTIYWLALALLLPSLSTGFVLPPKQTVQDVSTSRPVAVYEAFHRQAATFVMMSSEDDAGDQISSGRRRRRKRKVTVEETEEEPEEEEPAAPAVELKQREDTPVQFQVKDVRELVGGTVPSTETPAEDFPFSIPNPFKAFSDSSPATPSAPAPRSTSSDESLARLLEDAREMQEDEDENGVSEESPDTIKSKVRNVLSTIVTADFFLVLAFLLWFLAGIFCSSVLKDDAVQILFNSKYTTRRAVAAAAIILF
jgi:hypothetical protein